MVMLFTDLKVFFHSLGASAILLSRSFFIPWCFNQSSLPGRCASYLCKQQTNLKLVNNTYVKKSIMELQFACIDIIMHPVVSHASVAVVQYVSMLGHD
jgi:hypothetical protein